jgi:hypothetical protein
MKLFSPKKIYIVGSGIIGLSVAEYFSKQNKKITIISDENSFSGSYAAAANLATKGQLYARDPHFQMKLDSKKFYHEWISSLIFDSKSKIDNLSEIFQIGDGIDLFSNTNDRDKHLNRVLQNKEELTSRNLATNYILAKDKNTIIYKNEAWVNAPFILQILKKILITRNVIFKKEKFNTDHLNEIIEDKENSLLIFCTGAWTKPLLESLNIKLPNSFNRSERLTLGSTINFPQKNSNNYILTDIIDSNLKSKITISGNSQNTYLSSSTLKIKNLSDLNKTISVEEENRRLIQLYLNSNIIIEKNALYTTRTGYRVGYGHTELLLESIHLGFHQIKTIVCCGAHKSGFLLAPILGKKIEEIYL